jgi:uncharacterized repeat protein (TIGR04076 family)
MSQGGLIMPEYKYKVIAEVVEIRGDGRCSYGHKVGDRFEFTHLLPGGLCHFAYASLELGVSALLFGGELPWAKGSESTTWSCPDPDRTVIFKLTREPSA